MSLVGSLEDLGLGEILQIVSLSGKSGILWIRSRRGEGRIVFSRGLIRGAFAKDGPADLRELLAESGALEAAELARLGEEAAAQGVPLEALLCQRTALDAARIDEIREQHVEATVLRMFGWASGEFSFEIREQPTAEESEELLLRRGLNAQFLALEGTRIRDEGGRDAEAEAEAAAEGRAEPAAEDVAAAPAEDVAAQLAEDVSAQPAEDVETEPAEDIAAEPAEPIETELVVDAEVAGGDGPAELQITVLDLVDAEVPGEELPAVLGEEAAAAPHVDDEPTLSAPRQAGARAAPAAEPPARAGTGASAPAPGARARPASAKPAGSLLRGVGRTIGVVAIDRELAALEWIKRALAPLPVRVHIFQRTEQGIARIRQYVARGELPLVVLTTATPPDPVSGARDWSEIAARLRAQVPTLPLVLLGEPGVAISPANERAIPDALAPRPDLTVLSDERARERRETLAGELRRAFERARARLAPRGDAAPRDDSADALRSLREVSAHLRDPASRGDVLRLVMEFAARSFDRVAVFMVRDGEACGLAQIGLATTGGPDDHDMAHVRLPADEPAWFRKVLESRAPLRAAPDDEGDRDLACRLGHAPASEVYVAPIESGDRIAALLYADNLTTRRPLPDTSALEVVVHEAGLALERAVLERALEEAEDERGSSAPEAF